MYVISAFILLAAFIIAARLGEIVDELAAIVMLICYESEDEDTEEEEPVEEQ